MDNRQTEIQICKFIEELNFEDIPTSVVETSKKLLLDMIGVMNLSYQAESTTPIIASIQKIAGTETGTGTVVGNSLKLPPQYAVILNGILAHSSEFDDTNALGHSHPGAIIIPSVLVAAEHRGKITGEQFITAMVVGYEVMCRVGASLGKTVHQRGFHVTPLCGIFGAVAAISKIYDLDARTIHSALGLAGSLVSGSHQFSDNGAWNKRLHTGLMAHNALISVELASDGIIGATFPLTGSRGFLKGYTDDPLPEKLDEKLGVFWYTEKTAIKPYPACRLTHSAIDLIVNFVENYKISIGDIELMEIEISPRAFLATGERVDRKLNPMNIVDAQFSIYFQVAVALLTGKISSKSYDFIGDPQIPYLTKKITVNQRESLDKLETRIHIKTKSNEYLLQQKYPKGEPQNPIDWEEVVSKFLDTSVRLGKDSQNHLIRLIERFDKENNLKQFYLLLSNK